MRGLFGRLTESSITAFILFIVLVWLAVDVGKVLAQVAPARVPAWVVVLVDPNADSQKKQGASVLG